MEDSFSFPRLLDRIDMEEAGIWRSFCGQSQHQGDKKDPIFSKITQDFSCSNHAMVIFIDILLLLMLFLNVICKQSKVIQAPSRYRAQSFVQFLSAIFNGGLSVGYLGLGCWILADNYVKSHNIQPLNQWLVALFQGLTWLVTTLVVCLITPRGSRVFLRLWLAAICLFAAFLCGDSLLVIFRHRRVSIRVILDVLSLPGAILLAIFASRRFRYLHGCQNINEDLYAPLNGEDGSNENDAKDEVTCFARAGIISSLSFWWLNSLMKKGAQKELEEVDIPQLRFADRAENCSMLFLEDFNKQKKDDNTYPSLWWTLALCQRRQIIISGLFALLKVLTLSAGPLLLNAFIKVAEGKASFKYEGFILAAGLFFAKCLESISQRQWYFRTRLIGLQVRSSLCAEIYRKQLTLSNVAKMTHSAGEIMNYVTVDAYRIGEFPFWFHQSWTTSVQLCIALIILYHAVGLATIAALVVIILTVLCNTPLAKLQHKFQTKLMEAQDERLKATQEALVNMKILKLYAWETHFKSVIENLRKDEYRWLSAVQFRRAYNSFLFWSSPILVSAATFVSCYLLHIPLNVSNVFTFVATLRLVQDPIRTIPDVIGVVIQAKVAMARIQKFLEAPELQSEHINRSFSGMNEYAVAVKSCNFSWEDNLLKPTLRDIHLEVKPGKKVAICGEVGSGKSTLLAAILGEIPNVGGLIQVQGRLAYVSQTAWIQTGTIQENILFGLPMNAQRYKEAIEKCSLAKDLELLPFGDLTEIGERGVNLSGGQKQRIQLARAVYQDADIYLLDDPFSAVDAHTATSLFNECIMGALSGKTVLLVTHQVDFLPAFDFVLLMSDGEIKHAASYSLMLASSIEFRDLVDAHKTTAGSDKLAEVVFSKFPRTSTREIKKVSSANHSNSVNLVADEQLINKEEKERGDTGFRPYVQYLNQNKGYVYFTVAALAQVTFVAGQISQNSWMAANVQNPSVSTLRLISVYLAIGFCSTFFLFLRSFFGVILGLQSSNSLFSQLLNSLFRAPMSFFDSTPLGRILSRVSSDLSIIDLDLPFSLLFAFCATTNAYSNLGVLAVVTWQVLFVSIPMVYLSIRLQRYYFCSAKELMRFNGTTKSLVANHLAESISGAMTIRAFKEQDRFFAKNNGFIDRNASPFFHNFAANEWLIQRLETMSAAVLASSALAMSWLPTGTFSSGFIGMALSYGLSLNMSLVFSIQNQCTLANHIISVERINQYMHIPSEAAEIVEDNRPSPLWPSNGKVELHNLKIRYRPNSQLVLRGISCTFEGGHKIGIVGRTGSGKTTLISALFRLVEPAGGKIIIDGIDISKIGLHDLRSRFGIIPQDPTLFHGTVKYNLDPLSQHTDAKIWEVLGKCHLRQAVEEKEMGLDSLVVEDGSNWSMGQRQLFCLGRALLKRSRILVLDEATASVDNATDTILQKTIRSEFADSTVITVAHRIPTVMDCTMVLSISDGELVEYDEPMKLMKRQDSLFGKLVREYWSSSNTNG